MPTQFPVFVDTPAGETPAPGTPDVDAAYLNAVNGAINVVENTLPSKANTSALATVATSGAYTDLIGKPFIPDSPDDIGAQPAGSYATTTQLGLKADTASLHAVATSGSYVDLTNKPTIPAAYTDEQVRDVVGATLVAGTGVTITPNDAADTITIASTGGGGGQPADDDLTAIAALTPANDDVLQRKAGAWTNRTPAQLKTDLAVGIADVSGLQAALDAKATLSVAANLQSGTSYTLVLTDAGRVVEMSNAAANTLTIPPNTSVAFPIGTIIEVYQVGAGQTTVAAGAGVTLRAPNGGKLASQYATASVRKRGADEWVLAGDVTS